MPINIAPNSLVLYKSGPARVKTIGAKIELELTGGKGQSVRAKDVLLLHPGPLKSLTGLETNGAGEIEAAWELVAGEKTTLEELAELVYGTFTPGTAWATWKAVADGLYFSGTPEELSGHPPEAVAAEEKKRAEKAAAEAAWISFVQRVEQNRTENNDRPYLQEVAQLALGRTPTNRLLRALNRAETSENAHDLLLNLNYWDPTVNPYPQRFELPTDPPQLALSSLPDEERLDLTHLAAFAIDDAGSQDPDDAISLEGNCLWVHVADVAALIPPDAPADLEARSRGANLYLPEGTATMLPPQATEILALGLAPTSPALSFGLELDEAANPLKCTIAPSWIRVERLSYAEADLRLDTDPLAAIAALMQKAEARRRANNAVFIDWPEVKIRCREGQIDITPLPRLQSRDLVTEAMLLAGEAAARFALEHQLPFPFTQQAPPDLSRLPNPPPEGLAGMLALRKTLKPSQQSSVDGPHAGLGLEFYAQTTSPLRRYLDLVVHQQLRAHLRGSGILDEEAMLARVGAAQAIAASVRQTERLSNRHWTLLFLQSNPAWRGHGVLVDKKRQGGQIVIPALGLEAPIHLERDLPLNAEVEVELKGVNLPRLEVHFQLL